MNRLLLGDGVERRRDGPVPRPADAATGEGTPGQHVLPTTATGPVALQSELAGTATEPRQRRASAVATTGAWKGRRAERTVRAHRARLQGRGVLRKNTFFAKQTQFPGVLDGVE